MNSVTEMKKRILFVDDEPTMLELFQLMFKPLETDWDLGYATSGLEGLAMMDKQPFEVVITDMNMPGMNGAQFLNEVMEKHPRTARFILSGYAEQDTVAKCVGAAHQYLMKPCDMNTIRTTLSRVCALDVFLENGHLKDLVARMNVLPSIPSVYFQVMKELQSPYASMERIGELVSMDPAMTAKLLQMVNSAFFGICREISNPLDAIELLGVNTIRSLALSIHAFSCFDQKVSDKLSFEHVWSHCMAVGTFAKKIAQNQDTDTTLVDEAFIGGLLHDIGKLMLLANMPAQYEVAIDQARQKGIPLVEAEKEIFGATHASVGAYLLGLWGLPVPIVEAVALHHSPMENVQESFTPLTAVHIADVIEHEHSKTRDGLLPPEFHQSYLSDLGLLDSIPDWRSEFATMTSEGEAA